MLSVIPLNELSVCVQFLENVRVGGKYGELPWQSLSLGLAVGKGRNISEM